MESDGIRFFYISVGTISSLTPPILIYHVGQNMVLVLDFLVFHFL